MSVSILVVILVLLSYALYSTAYQLPQFPETVTVTFNYQPVTPGQRLSQSNAAAAPSISLPSAATSSLYSVLLIDPDAPSASNPVMANWLHYLHTNVDGHALTQPLDLSTTSLPHTASSTLSTTYAPPTPPPATGPHRYVLLVYRQSSVLPSVQSLHIEQASDSRRGKWSLVQWERQAAEAGVAVQLVAGSYFVVEYGVDEEEASELSIKQDM